MTKELYNHHIMTTLEGFGYGICMLAEQNN